MSSTRVAAHPNVVIIHCHDLGRFISPYGVDTVHTPHLQALAESGVVFERAFAAAPHCSPARAALFTSTYPQRNGVFGLTHSPFDWDLTNPSDHLAHFLHTAGYRTALVGVHHESRQLADDVVARRLGFDNVHTGGHGKVVAELSIRMLSDLAAASRPFYLQIGFHEPHRIHSRRDAPGVMGFLGDHIEPDDSLGVTVPPYLHDDDMARAEIAELQGAVRYMDSQVGEILQAIDRLGLVDSTLVVFTTDHGLALPRAKCSLYEPGLEVALVMRAPFRAGWAGRRVDGLVSHVDVGPTIHQLVGLGSRPGLDGHSLVPAVEEAAPSAEHIYGQMTYHTYYDPKRSVRSQRHKLIINFASTPLPMDPTQSWARRTTPREIWRRGLTTSSPSEFYDLQTDPDEQVNLAFDPAYSQPRADLAEALVTWMEGVGDPLLTSAVTSPHHNQALQVLTSLAGLGSSKGGVSHQERGGTPKPFDELRTAGSGGLIGDSRRL